VPFDPFRRNAIKLRRPGFAIPAHSATPVEHPFDTPLDHAVGPRRWTTPSNHAVQDHAVQTTPFNPPFKPRRSTHAVQTTPFNPRRSIHAVQATPFKTTPFKTTPFKTTPFRTTPFKPRRSAISFHIFVPARPHLAHRALPSTADTSILEGNADTSLEPQRSTMPKPNLNLLQGTLDLVVLKALGFGPLHGYQVARWVRATTDGELTVDDGALYTALHRLQKRGWLSAEWGVTEQNRRAKYYALTTSGRRQMAAETSAWERYAQAIFKVLSATAGAV
jgi:PadR family transcriptional regulator PadR